MHRFSDVLVTVVVVVSLETTDGPPWGFYVPIRFSNPQVTQDSVPN